MKIHLRSYINDGLWKFSRGSNFSGFCDIVLFTKFNPWDFIKELGVVWWKSTLGNTVAQHI